MPFLRLRDLTACCLIVATCAATTSAAGEERELQRQQAIRAAVAVATDSVVQIETLGGLERVGRLLVSNAPTSGVVVSNDGLIVSSAFNFVQQPNSILVTLPDGTRHAAHIVSRDLSRMLVLLKIDADVKLTMPTAAPRSSLRVGQTVIALGKTFDSQRANLSVGILSATDRIWGKAVQTDAKISPANYGGALIDLEGQVLGMLVPMSPESEQELAGAEWYDSGIGFAVPLSEILRQLPRWSQGDDLKPGKLGITLKDEESLDPEPVVGVVKLKSPAAQMGLKPGDRIVSLDGRPVQRFSQLRHLLAPRYAGDEITLTISRDGQELQLKSTLVAQIPPYEHAFLGVLLQRQAADDAAIVRYVFSDSPAMRLGLQAGDRIVNWQTESITKVDQLRLALANAEPEATVEVTWERAGQTARDTTTLARLPHAIADDVPAADDGAPKPDLTVGEQPLAIPEVTNECTAYLPDSMRRGHVPGLLIVLHPPADIKAAEIVGAWKDVCEQNDLILMVPSPAMEGRWTSLEVSYLRKLIDQAKSRYGVDPQRIAIYGRGAGGVLAYLTMTRHRDVIRGLAILDAEMPIDPENIETEPLSRLAFLYYTTPSADSAAELADDANAWEARKFPVTRRALAAGAKDLDGSDRAALGQWLNSLDRL